MNDAKVTSAVASNENNLNITDLSELQLNMLHGLLFYLLYGIKFFYINLLWLLYRMVYVFYIIWWLLYKMAHEENWAI